MINKKTDERLEKIDALMDDDEAADKVMSEIYLINAGIPVWFADLSCMTGCFLCERFKFNDGVFKWFINTSIRTLMKGFLVSSSIVDKPVCEMRKVKMESPVKVYGDGQQNRLYCEAGNPERKKIEEDLFGKDASYRKAMSKAEAYIKGNAELTSILNRECEKNKPLFLWVGKNIGYAVNDLISEYGDFSEEILNAIQERLMDLWCAAFLFGKEAEALRKGDTDVRAQ